MLSTFVSACHVDWIGDLSGEQWGGREFRDGYGQAQVSAAT